ncbi:MAG: hypothetical protein ACE5HE_10310 [Phycisphaerae bacterium]
MITVRYDPSLIERAVWLAARRDVGAERDLHNAIDPIFELPQGDDREALFQEAFVRWFKHLKLDQFIDEMLMHFPHIVGQVKLGVVRPASRRKSEGAELFVRDDSGAPGRTLVLQVCPESLVATETIRDTMLRELQHVEDMLDASFDYVPESIEGLPPRQQVVRDRYRVLWDIRVEAALARRGLLVHTDKVRLERQFVHAFTIGGARPELGLFDGVWKREHVPHPQLLAWAKDARAWVGNGAQQQVGAPATTPGESCAVCGFPTFDWYTPADELHEAVRRSIRQARPDWSPPDGICRQCAETFISEAALRT